MSGLKDILKKYNLNFFSELQNMILRDENFFSQVLCDMTITVSEFFRDPEIYKALREHITDELKTYPHIKIWHAGCATGEEVYSMAILLKEEKLYDKAQIYATDINTRALNKAKKGINSSNSFTKASEQYFMAGGKESLSNYYSADDKSVLIAPSLHKNIVFSDHNLVSDSKFGEMNLILCRNVLIYFNKDLQNRALKLMADSLVPGGFLVLGTKESITFTDIAKDGLMEGLNFSDTKNLVEYVSIPVIGSGGINGPENLKSVKKIFNLNFKNLTSELGIFLIEK